MTDRERRAGMPTLTDVARLAGVSMATASRVFSGSTTVDPELAERVLAAGRRLEYSPDAAAQMTAAGRSSLIGVIADRPREPRFAVVSSGIVEAAGSFGLTAMISGASSDAASFVAATRTMVGYRPRGVIIVARGDALRALALDSAFAKLSSNAEAFVAIGGGDIASPIPCVLLDDASGAIDLAAELGRRGYRRPLVVGTPTTFPSEASRTDVLLREAARWSGHVDVVIADAPTRGAGLDAVSARLDADGAAIDVILCVSDELAVGAMAALRQRGLTPGRDVGVSGFDDLPVARDVHPPLTTVNTRLAEAGARAVAVALGTAAETSGDLRSTAVVRASTPPAGS